MRNLSASQEDYLEIISNLLETKQSVKAVEIAKELNISRASVSEALAKLVDKGLILYDRHNGISITEEGKLAASEVISKHKTLTSFFNLTLGLKEEDAQNNACRIEHVISDELFSRIENFQKFCSQNEEFIDSFKKELVK